MIRFTLNGETVAYEGETDLPLLWFLRDEQGLIGTKFGCGIAQCGACTVHVNSEPRRSCVTAVGDLDGAEVVTIEGFKGEVAEALHTAWVKHDVAQCGYCQSGQIMSAAGLLQSLPKPTDEDIDLAMNGNICRCCTYHRIRVAIHDAASHLEG